MTGAGAASLAMSGPAPTPAARGAVRGDGAARPPADAKAADAPASAERGKAAERAARPGEQAEDTPPAPAQSFAQLLTQAPPAPPPAPAPAPAVDAPAAGTDADPTSPGQLLALLDGSWSGAGPAASVPAATAAAAATGAQPATALSAAATVAATAAAQPAPDVEPAGAEHALPLLAAESDAPSILAASPALEAAAIARDAGAATQAAPAIEAPTAGIAGTTPLATARPQAAPALPPLPMPANPDAGFDEGFGTRLVWMAEQRVGHAEIRLNPEHVGPIEVRVRLDGEQVRAEFHSAHAEVRQAIEASLPRLRELLGQHGLQLGQADVGQGQAGRDGADARPAGTGRGTGDAGAATSGETSPSRILRARGLVDAYA